MTNEEIKEMFNSRVGHYPTYKGFLMTTNSSQKRTLESLFGEESLLNIYEGTVALLKNHNGTVAQTGVVTEIIIDRDIIKFWTKSGSYFCFCLN